MLLPFYGLKVLEHSLSETHGCVSAQYAAQGTQHAGAQSVYEFCPLYTAQNKQRFNPAKNDAETKKIRNKLVERVQHRHTHTRTHTHRHTHTHTHNWPSNLQIAPEFVLFRFSGGVAWLLQQTSGLCGGCGVSCSWCRVCTKMKKWKRR